MYDIRVIRGNKKCILVNYINSLHDFNKNLGGILLKFMSIFLIPKIQEGGRIFGRGSSRYSQWFCIWFSRYEIKAMQTWF